MTVPIQWRTKKQRYSLQGSICPKCSGVVFPPRGVCPHCGRDHEESFTGSHNSADFANGISQPLVFALPAVSEEVALAAGDD